MSRKAKEPKGGTTTTAAGKAPATGKGEPMEEKQMLLIARAIADPRRMAMLRTIAQNTSTCSDLRQCTSISAATLSHHMKELETAGLIETRKDGRFLSANLQKKVWKSYVASLKAIGG